MKVMIARLIGLIVCCGEENTKVTPNSRAADQKDKIEDTGRRKLPLKLLFLVDIG